MAAEPAFVDASSHDILAIGSLVIDISCTYVHNPDNTSSDGPQKGSSNPATITQCVGGVAHNIALAAKYMGASVLLASVIGDDSAGESLLQSLSEEGLSTDGVIKLRSSEEHGEVRTGQYVGNYNHNKDFIFGMADVKLMTHPLTEDEDLWNTLIDKVRPKLIVLDTTFSLTTVEIIARLAQEKRIYVVVEPTSSPRAESIPDSALLRSLRTGTNSARFDILTPNMQELQAMIRGMENNKLIDNPSLSEGVNTDIESILSDADLSHDELETISRAMAVLSFIPVVIVTLGDQGCILLLRIGTQLEHYKSEPGLVSLPDLGYSALVKHYKPVARLDSKDIVSVNGAGDSLVGAVVTELVRILKMQEQAKSEHLPSLAEVVSLSEWDRIIDQGQWASIATLQDSSAVGHSLRDLDSFKKRFDPR